MNYRKLGKTDVLVSEISLGCWTMGGALSNSWGSFGWAEIDEDEIFIAIKTALDAGINHFDTADGYGHGRSERLLTKILKKLGIKPQEVVIASKVGHFLGTANHAYEPKHIKHQFEQSLVNLERDYLDIYYFHHGSFGPYLHEAAAVMDDLVKQGLVRLKGQSAYSLEDFQTAIPVVKPDVLQSWAHMLDDQFIRKDSGLQSLMDEYGCTLVAYSTLAQGRLLDKFDPSNPPSFPMGDHRIDKATFKAEALAALKPKLEKLKTRFGATTADLSAVAQRYVLKHSNVACVILGFRNENQVRCNLAAIERELSNEDLDFIRSTFQ